MNPEDDLPVDAFMMQWNMTHSGDSFLPVDAFMTHWNLDPLDPPSSWTTNTGSRMALDSED